MSYEKLFDQVEDGVDPRVQVELEKLNCSTDEINKLEVDLDEARSQFRQLLKESSVQIENSAKKLGNCIVKVRPYYDARIRAKEALEETQKAAANFERANSAHAAAKEMVYLAEEGLKTEGRTFDHAWQEMLNHATMRVNETESERMRCEAEHKKTSQLYQIAEIRVHTLQKELKRAITKSRPYFELKIHYSQLLEKQKKKVKNLEKQVADVKLTYAHTLKNLEQISDEIHKNRQKTNERDPSDSKTKSKDVETTSFYRNDISNGCKVDDKRMENPALHQGGQTHIKDHKDCSKSESQHHKEDPKIKFEHNINCIESNKKREKDACFRGEFKLLSPASDTISSSRTQTSTTTFSSQPDTDVWSENSDDNLKVSPTSDNDSSFTGPPDIESEEETFKLSKILDYNRLSNSKVECEGNVGDTGTETGFRFEDSIFTKVEICSFLNEKELGVNIGYENLGNYNRVTDSESGWTEINLRSPEEEIFSTVKAFCVGKREKDGQALDIPYAPLAEIESLNFESESPENGLTIKRCEEKNNVEEVFTNFVNCRKLEVNENEDSSGRSVAGTPKKHTIRRQSLDVLWNSQEKVKEILSQSIMKLNISTLTEKKPSDTKFGEGSGLTGGDHCSKGKQSVTSSQSGKNIFNGKTLKIEDDVNLSNSEGKTKGTFQDSLSGQLGGFMSRKERFFTKKIPSPLERTLNYLNTDDESNSDSESLASLDALTDEQLSSLILDKDFAEIYQDLI